MQHAPGGAALVVSIVPESTVLPKEQESSLRNRATRGMRLAVKMLVGPASCVPKSTVLPRIRLFDKPYAWAWDAVRHTMLSGLVPSHPYMYQHPGVQEGVYRPPRPWEAQAGRCVWFFGAGSSVQALGS